MITERTNQLNDQKVEEVERGGEPKQNDPQLTKRRLDSQMGQCWKLNA